MPLFPSHGSAPLPPAPRRAFLLRILRPRWGPGPPEQLPPEPAPKRARPSSGDGKSLEQNSLFEAVFSGRVATEPLVDEWLEWYRRGPGGSFLELLNFTVRSCGCRGVVTPQMFRELQNSEIIQRLTETFQEDSPEYPFSRRSPAWRRFRAGFAELPAALVRRGQHRELWDGFLMDSWLSFLAGLADSQVRPFRHIGTLAALKLMSSLVEVAVGVGQQQENCQRQFEAEKGKEPRQRATERLEALWERQRELQEQQQELEMLMNGIFKGVFVHRYRDVVPEIRGICMEELGLWVRRFPGSFLTDSHLKYLGWTLHDKHGEVRLRCVRALQGIYRNPEMAPNLELFTERFKARLVAMAHDKEPEVALEALRLLRELDRNLEEALSPEDCQSIFPVVFVSSRALATAAGSFLFQRLLDPGRFGDGADDNRSFLRRLAGFFLQAQLHEHAAYLVDSLWDCAGSRLRDWDAATALLLQSGTALPFQEEQALVQILSSSALRLCQGQPPVGRGPARKASPREQREERARLSRSLIPVLPQLLEKFSAEPEAVAALLELLQHLELGSSRTARTEKCLEQVLGRILEVFGKHSQPFPALSAASRALRALCEPELPLHGLGDIARSRLGDSLGDRCQLQVSEMLQAVSPDEEDVYGLAATLRRLSVLFSDHDLTPWGLFVPLSQLLRHGLDTGNVPAQVMVPAISCLFFHFFWELSRVVDSEASPGDLQALRSRAALLLSLCQSCLSEPEPDLRETEIPGKPEPSKESPHGAPRRDADARAPCPQALQALQELLLLLGPGLPQARLRLRPEPALEAQLGLALLDLVFQPRPPRSRFPSARRPRSPGIPGFSLPEAAGPGLGALQRRRSLLAGFCRLLVRGALRLRAAADVFKHYGTFSGDFGDIIRETLRCTRDLDRPEWARTVLLSLQQLFTELLLQEGPELRGLPEFQEIRDLGRRLSLFFSPRQLQSRQPLLLLHSEGIQFSLQPPPE
ncbi:cohesin subunit SA-3-like, partial [Anomalospiza imberbis]|uniref:cohesin subunit SA-3-like n=2 Tax=Anomalospiza imberbis TaxID=187417 RepID=UPI00358E99F5